MDSLSGVEARNDRGRLWRVSQHCPYCPGATDMVCIFNMACRPCPRLDEAWSKGGTHAPCETSHPSRPQTPAKLNPRDGPSHVPQCRRIYVSCLTRRPHRRAVECLGYRHLVSTPGDYGQEPHLLLNHRGVHPADTEALNAKRPTLQSGHYRQPRAARGGKVATHKCRHRVPACSGCPALG